ncbi:unnamed protein product [Eruca vesicaria subsp. sativa]|uniref:CWF21 domain-containing protein n=1 Tax=Eruca vesicaria subsp. sativa TaxID=29727 RepID=A0ABC8JU63_ERUVS|nr:unnamed protein product [Eruca vesicaria subsp. sativa]
MYNGIGLQTARGSGTNGYVQTNKFIVRPRNGGTPVNGGKGFEDGQGTAGLSKKPNRDILEHDRKRQIHLKLAVLEDEHSDQGFSDAEIAQKIEEARVKFEAAASEESDAKISDTQTHQVAARKEKQMEAFRAVLGLRDQEQAEEGIIDDEPEVVVKERREHSSDSDSDSRKKRRKATKKGGRSKRSVSSESVSEDESDDSQKLRKSHKKSRPSNLSGSKEARDKHEEKRRGGRKRHDSDVSESESEQEEAHRGRKKHEEEAVSKHGKDNYRGGSRGKKAVRDSDNSETEYEKNKKQLRSKIEVYSGGMSKEEDAVAKQDKDRYRSDSHSKKVARDSDDSEAEYENRRKLKDESHQRGRKHI